MVLPAPGLQRWPLRLCPFERPARREKRPEMSSPAVPSLFPSFFIGGFECSMPTLPDGRRLDQIAASQHDIQCAGDYRLLRDAGLLAVREAVRWPLVDRGGRLDFTSLAPCVRALREVGLVP